MSTSTNVSNYQTATGKPASLKAIQILVIVRALLVLGFYIVFTVKDIKIGSVGPQIILYTFLAFAVLAIPIFYFIRKRNVKGLRIALLVDLLAALPVSAFISIALSLVELGLTFTKSARNYFED